VAYAAFQFSLEIQGQGMHHAAAVRDLEMTAPKIPLERGGAFAQGRPAFGDIEISTSSGSTPTSAFLDQWAQNVSQGLDDTRSGVIRILSADLRTELGRVTLDTLKPLTDLAPFAAGGRPRSMKLSLRSFDISGP
jgi:hypothetical protein